MKLRNTIKILVSFCLFGIALSAFPTSETLSSPPVTAAASISATATVIEPLGLISTPDAGQALPFLFYSPHHSRSFCEITYCSGPDFHADSIRTFLSSSDYPAHVIEIPRSGASSIESTGCIVTVIPTEN
jgi:hypothetical protein